jgi:hypothetical protein
MARTIVVAALLLVSALGEPLGAGQESAHRRMPPVPHAVRRPGRVGASDRLPLSAQAGTRRAFW